MYSPEAEFTIYVFLKSIDNENIITKTEINNEWNIFPLKRSS